MSGRINQLNEFVITRVAQAVVIRVAGNSVRWIGQRFVDENVAGEISRKGYRDGVAGSAIRLNKQIHGSRSAEIARHDDMYFIEARHVGGGNYSFSVDDSADHDDR